MPIIALPFLAATVAAPAVAHDTCFSGLVAFDGEHASDEPRQRGRRRLL